MLCLSLSFFLCVLFHSSFAKANSLKSVVFCCISTGEFRFSNQEAAEIVVKTVKAVLVEKPEMRVVFNVSKDVDLRIYLEVLGLEVGWALAHR
ncbi:hypothetical protein DPV98_08965 [Haemophilus parahaemolyticus]|uniref:Macro domain-containing protein n=1 Tax=Haemophilus parahaemolyticus TaxID=735 RepID=A0A369ZB46_HAEPH|nr:hypothetical protein DPV98_08965 [Haemophilus parahaemolyticus]